MEEDQDIKYIKNYDKWNQRKKTLYNKILPDSFFFLEREIWWASVGVNVGHEIDGKNDDFARPVLIFKKISEDTLWALPLSSAEKEGNYFYNIMQGGKKRVVLLLQIRFISANRLLQLISRIDENEFALIQDQIIGIIRGKEETP